MIDTADQDMTANFTGPLIWITMGGNIDVRHPDGRDVRAAVLQSKHGRDAVRLGKSAMVTVKETVDGLGNRSAYVLDVAEA